MTEQEEHVAFLLTQFSRPPLDYGDARLRAAELVEEDDAGDENDRPSEASARPETGGPAETNIAGGPPAEGGKPW